MDTTSWGRRALLDTAFALVIVLAVLVAFTVGRRIARGPGARFAITQTRPVASRIDGASYHVHAAAADAEGAADALAAVNGRALGLLRFLRGRYLRGPAGRRQLATQRLLARYNPDNLAENSPSDPTGDTAYSLDKGAVLALCLRERGGPNSGALHSLDTLTFVAFHEMAHVATDVPAGADDHPPAFWATFRFLLEAGEGAGVFAPPDYARAPVTYCGVRVDYSPRWDPALQPI